MSLRLCPPIRIILVCIPVTLGIIACAPSPADPAAALTLPAEATRTPAVPSAPAAARTTTPELAITPKAPPANALESSALVLPGWVPEGARARLGRGRINDASLSPDGGRIAVAGATGLAVFDADTLEEAWSVPTAMELSNVFSAADGGSIVTLTAGIWDMPTVEFVSAVDSVHVWNAEDGRLIRAFQLDIYASNRIKAAVSADGGTLAVVRQGDYDVTRIELWDLSSGRQKYILADVKIHVDERIVFAAQDDVLIAASASGDVLPWNPESGEVVRRLQGVGGGIEHSALDGMAVSPDGRLLAVIIDRTVYGWDLSGGEELFALEGLDGYRFVLAFSPDGRILAAGDQAGNVILWDAESGGRLQTLSNAGDTVNSLAFSPDGTKLCAGLEDSITLYDPSTGARLGVLDEPYSSWKDADFLPGGMELGLRGNRRIQKATISDFEFGDVFPIPALSFVAPDYRRYAVWSAESGLMVYETENGKQVAVIADPGLPGEFSDFYFSPDGTKGVFVSGKDLQEEYPFQAVFWDLIRKEKLFALDFPSYGRYPSAVKVFFSPDGKYAALGFFDREFGMTLAVHEASTGKRTGFLDEMGRLLFAFSPDGGVAAGPCLLSICLYDISGENPRSPFDVDEATGMDLRIVSLFFSSEGSLLAAGTDSGEVVIWDAAGAELVSVLRGHTGGVSRISFSRDDRYLVSTGSDGSVVVWDVRYQ
jgi:WD40 repeat protein